MNMQDEAAAALSGQRPSGPPSPQPGGAQPPAGATAPQGAQGGSLAAFAQAFARCEQTHQCSPQDRAILEAGLPQLIQMAKLTQQILQATQPGQQQPPQGQAPAPQPGVQ